MLYQYFVFTCYSHVLPANICKPADKGTITKVRPARAAAPVAAQITPRAALSISTTENTT